MATTETPTNQNAQQLSEEKERASLEALILLNNSIRAGQHTKFNQNAILQDKSNTGYNLTGPGAKLNGHATNKVPEAGPPSNGVPARPIPVFLPGLPTPSKNESGAVVTINGKDSPKRSGKDKREERRQQHHAAQALQQQHLSQSQQQWETNQHWAMASGQHHTQGTQGDVNAFAHLAMLPVPPPGFEMPPGFPLIPVPPPLPPHGQPLPQHILQLSNQNLPQSDRMALDRPLDKNDRELASHQLRKNETDQDLMSPGTNDFQASLKKAQEYAASLPPKPNNDPKQNIPASLDPNKQPLGERIRNNSTDPSPTTPGFPYADRREEERQGFQRQPPRDHRQYNDKRGAEPLRKTAMNNNHNSKDDRREAERDQQATREKERFQDRDRRQPPAVENRNFKVSPILSPSNSPGSYEYDDTKAGIYMQKRRSTSPAYDVPPKHSGSGYAPRPGRPGEAMALTRSHEDHKAADFHEGDDAFGDPKKRANTFKDNAKPQQNQEKKPSPQAPAKREPAPPSPVVTIPRGSPTLEPLSPGRGRAYMAPAPQDRYGAPEGIKQPGYFRYREPYHPMVGYARSPYDPYDGYPPAPHAREPRPLSPRRMYLPPEGRSYAQEYVYPDPYQDPYYGYPPPPPRRLGSPPGRLPPGPRYRYEGEEPPRPPPGGQLPTRGRSPSPRGPGRMPIARPRRSSRSVSPPRERPPPRAPTASNEPSDDQRQERSLIRASDAPQYAEYPPYPRAMAPYDPYGDPYGRPMIIRERVPVYVTRVVYVDPNDPEARPYRPRSPSGYPAAAPPPPPPHAQGGHPPPPPMRRYADDPELMMNERYNYRERDYDYGPYERGPYPRDYGREYPAHPPPPPPPHARDGYPREYSMPPIARDDERGFREREYGSHPPPPPTPRDAEDPRLQYARDVRGGPPPPVPAGRY